MPKETVLKLKIFAFGKKKFSKPQIKLKELLVFHSENNVII